MSTTSQEPISTHLPAAGAWTIDPARSSIGFEAKLVLGLKARGRFERYDAAVAVGATAAGWSITVTVWTSSLTTGIAKRDEHLRAGDVFDAGRHPTLTFRSTALSADAEGLDVEGVLRVRGIDRPVAFRATRSGDHDAPRYTAALVVAAGAFGFTRRGTTRPVTTTLDVVLTRA